MIKNGANEKDYDNPEANKDFHPPKYKDQYYCPQHCEGDKVLVVRSANTSLMPIKEKT